MQNNTEYSITSFLKSFFENLNDAKIRYCVLRNFEQLPLSTGGSDIDMWVHEDDVQNCIAVLSSVSESTKMNLVTFFGDSTAIKVGLQNNNDGVCTGHFFAVAENYQKIFDDVCEVKVAGGPIYVGHFKEEDLFLLPCDGICGESKIKNLISTIRNAWRLFSKVTPNDVVVIQQSVPAMLLFSLLFTYFGSSNVYMIQYNDEPMSRLYFKIMMFLAGNRIKGIICPNDKVGKAYKRPYIVVPDYIYTKKQNEAIIPFSQKNFDFCVVGRLNNDKGIIEVINFFKDKSYSLLIAGKPENDAFKEKILKAAENAPNVKLQLGYVSEQDYKSILLQSRFCLLNYCGDYVNRSSGVVLDTIFQGVPVVGRECKALQFVRDYDVGYLYKEISSFNPDDVMNEDLYEKFKLNITHYQKENKKNKELLQSFLRL